MAQIDAMADLLESCPDALLLCDQSGAIVAVNELLLTMTGHSSGDLLGEGIHLLFPEGLNQTIDLSHERSDGTQRPTANELASRVLTVDGDRVAVRVALGNRGSESDPTLIRIRPDMEWPERSASGSQGWLRELLEQGALYVVGLDATGIVNYVNPTLSELLGRSPDEVVGVNWLENFILEDERVWLRDVFDSVLSDESPGSYIENSLCVPGGRPRQIRWFNMRLVDQSGEVEGTLSIGTDVTDRQRLERRLMASANVAGALLQESEIPAVLEVVAVGARDLVWAEMAMILTSNNGSGLVVEAVSGMDNSDLVGLSIPDGSWDSSIDARAQAPSEELGAHLRSLLPWPEGPTVAVGLWGRRYHGILLVANPPEHAPFEAEDKGALEGYAKEAALSIEHAQANKRLHHLAIVEDRERIARDLHDIVIQDLFSAGMSIDVVMQLVEGNQEAESRLAEVVDALNRAIDELRGSIFSLRDDSAEDLRTRVMRLIAEATNALGLTPVVRVENATKPLSRPVANHLLATLREALSNVARHSEATEVEIHVVAGPEVKLIVHDDGTGLPEQIPEGEGLKNMAARAVELGGEMAITEPTEGGLRIEWTVPAFQAAD
jgi:PAS domain S-box-containing protein